MKRRGAGGLEHRIRIRNVDRHTAESLYLELRRLAQTYGAEVVRFRVTEPARKKRSA